MANLITSDQVKAVVTPVVALDPAFFDTSIQYVEDSIICGILTKNLYDNLLFALTTPPLSAAYQELYDIVVNAESYAVAFAGYTKDLERKTNNQGFMENHTQWSKSAKVTEANRLLASIKEREFFYCKQLGDFLIENQADYIFFDPEAITYSPNFRRFFPI